MAKKNAKPDEMAVILRLVVDEISKLTKSERKALVQGAAGLQVRVVEKESRAAKRSQPQSGKESQEIAYKLHDAQSVNEANAILHEACPGKKDLEALARFLDLPVQSNDTIARLRERIVDATVGFRLRSSAIRGEV